MKTNKYKRYHTKLTKLRTLLDEGCELDDKHFVDELLQMIEIDKKPTLTKGMMMAINRIWRITNMKDDSDYITNRLPNSKKAKKGGSVYLRYKSGHIKEYKNIDYPEQYVNKILTNGARGVVDVWYDEI